MIRKFVRQASELLVPYFPWSWGCCPLEIVLSGRGSRVCWGLSEWSRKTEESLPLLLEDPLWAAAATAQE